MPKRNQKDITSLIEEFHYPKYGPGMMWERCRELVEAEGTKVVMETPGHRASATRTAGPWRSSPSTGGAETTLPGHRRRLVDADHRAGARHGPAGARRRARPQPTGCATATSSPLRSSCRRSTRFPDNWIYIHDPDVEVGRIQNFGSWSPYLVQGGPHLPRARVLRVRGRRAVDDGRRRSRRAGHAGARAARPGRRRAPSRPATSCACRRRTRSTTSTTRRTLQTMPRRGSTANTPNVHPVGRNGMHKYNNQDHSMLTAMLVGREHPGGRPRHLVGQRRGGVPRGEEGVPRRLSPERRGKSGCRTTEFASSSGGCPRS